MDDNNKLAEPTNRSTDTKPDFGAEREGNSFGSGSGANTTYESGQNLGAMGSGTSGTSSGIGTTGSGTTGSSGMSEANGLAPVTPIGTTAAAEGGISAGIVAMLEKFGVSESQLNTVRETLKGVNLDESIDKAKETVTDSVNKARQYARQNPGAVMAGLAVLVIGAGLIAGNAVRKHNE